MGVTNEDAIKWLENLKQDIGQLRHEDLWPYAQAIDEIIAMLEAQEPKEAKRGSVGGFACFVCGNCGVAITEGDRYCRQCGRKLLWK